MNSVIRAVPRHLAIALMFATLPAGLRAQDSALTSILVATRLPIEMKDGVLTGSGGRLLVSEGVRSRFFLVGEEHGVAEAPMVVQALLRELRPAGYNTLAIEVSPLQGERLDAMSGRPGNRDALDTLLSAWLTAVPFYVMKEERLLLASAMNRQDASPAMRIWGLDYEVSADRLLLRELETLVPPGGRESVRRARTLADSGFALLMRGNPSRLFAFSAPESVFTDLRRAIGRAPSAPARAIVDVLQRTAQINRNFRVGRGYESNLDRAAWLRQNFATAMATAERNGRAPRVLFKFGGSHMMRGFNYTHTLDLGTATTIVAEARGERSFNLLILAGPGSRNTRMNIVKGQYEPTDTAEVEGEGYAWLRPALADSGWSLFDLRTARERFAGQRRQNLTPIPDRLVHAFDAILVLKGSSPGTVLPLEMRE